MPTPIAAVAAAIAQRSGRALPQAANAAHAEPATQETARAAATAPGNEARPRRGPPQADVVAQSRADAARGALPAYASTPRRTGIALTLIVACFVVAVGAFFAWRMLEPGSTERDGSNGTGDSVMAAFPPDATPSKSNRSAPSDASQAASPAPEGVPANADRETAAAPREPTRPAAAGAVDGAASSATSPAVEITALPAKPVKRPSRRAPEGETRGVAPSAAVAPAAPAAPASAPPSTAVAAAPKVAMPSSVDRLGRLREELAACTREDFIARVVCGQRARFRHCEGYWGKVPECPGNPAPDHGQ